MFPVLIDFALKARLFSPTDNTVRMPRKHTAKIAAGSLILLLCTAQAFPFSTFDSNFGTIIQYIFGKPFGFIHREITLKALEPLEIAEKYRERIAYWNWRPDWDETHKWPPKFLPNKCYKPEHHFDRNEASQDAGKQAEAFMRGAKYVKEQRAVVVAGLKKEQGKDLGDALQATGRAFHAMQDFFSHSNVIDLSPREFAAVKKALAEASVPPAELMITGYDIELGGSAESEPFSHDLNSKDEPEFNDTARSPLNTGSAFYDAGNPGRTKFEAAREAATDHSRQWLENIRDEVGPETWARLADGTIEVKITDEGCAAGGESSAAADTSNRMYALYYTRGSHNGPNFSILDR